MWKNNWIKHLYSLLPLFTSSHECESTFRLVIKTHNGLKFCYLISRLITEAPAKYGISREIHQTKCVVESNIHSWSCSSTAENFRHRELRNPPALKRHNDAWLRTRAKWLDLWFIWELFGASKKTSSYFRGAKGSAGSAGVIRTLWTPQFKPAEVLLEDKTVISRIQLCLERQPVGEFSPFGPTSVTKRH